MSKSRKYKVVPCFIHVDATIKDEIGYIEKRIKNFLPSIVVMYDEKEDTRITRHPVTTREQFEQLDLA